MPLNSTLSGRPELSRIPIDHAEPGLQCVVNPVSAASAAAATPSTTNSTIPSPPLTPHTPHSSNGMKMALLKNVGSASLGLSNPNGATRPFVPSSQLDVVDAAELKSSSYFGADINVASKPAPDNGNTTGSISVGNGLSGGSGKVGKGRDRQARLRRRLKCCSEDQLVDQILELVRTDVLSEDAVVATTPSVDVEHLLEKCRISHNLMVSELPLDARVDGDTSLSEHVETDGLDYQLDDNNEFSNGRVQTADKTGKIRELDSSLSKQYRRNFTRFRSSVFSCGKLLQDAGLWKELLAFSVGAASINDRTPLRVEESLNKLCKQVSTKLEQYARKGGSELVKGLNGVSISGTDEANCVHAIDKFANECAQPFPDVAEILRSSLNRTG